MLRLVKKEVCLPFRSYSLEKSGHTKKKSDQIIQKTTILAGYYSYRVLFLIDSVFPIFRGGSLLSYFCYNVTVPLQHLFL